MADSYGTNPSPPSFSVHVKRIPVALRDWIIKKVSRAIQVLWRVSVGLFTWARRQFCRTGARCRDSCTKSGVRLSLLSICGCVFVSKAVDENCVGYWMRGILLVYKGQRLYRVKGREGDKGQQGWKKERKREREWGRDKAREAEGGTLRPLEVLSSCKPLLMAWLYRSGLV